ncbi:hypothetical protein GOQ30_12680 [Flavobacterium sp. TP390]|uniref:Uncharacterized protein n=1 Tax=Flavobacterium profundi TaxID=1774945 RepID=A0A6I4IT29_9FLAO|nr:hypothetical protein [Flavobacterium profundi]MVO10019.1 hypothetical protein [Flavobacterium profundi]
MLFNTTYVDNAITREINTLLGKPYSFLKAIQLKGTGSHRMMIEEVSPHFRNVLNTNSDINYANIELRPKGIILHINKGLQNYSWIIPYFKLALFQSETLSIHADGMFIKFRNNQYVRKNYSFLAKILRLKEQFIQSDYVNISNT